jgi:hypothetical protein
MTDRGSSFVAAVAMAAMFAVGVAFGIALDHRVLHRRPARVAFGGGGDRPRVPFMVPPALPGAGRPPSPNAIGPGSERAVDAFARDLALSPEQRAVADSILRHEFEEANAIREETWPRMEAVMNDTRRKLDSLLTPAQRERYHALLAEQEQRFRAREPSSAGRPPFPPHSR